MRATKSIIWLITLAIVAGIALFRLPVKDHTLNNQSPNQNTEETKTQNTEIQSTNIVQPVGGGGIMPEPAPQPIVNPPKAGVGVKANAPALLSVKNCLGQAGKTGECLDALFGKFFDEGGTTGEALAQTREWEASDTDFRYSCHPVMHAIGRETFRRHPTVLESFQQCDQTCHSGCYHGAMERFLRGNLAGNDEAGHITEEEVIAKAKTACDSNQPTRFRFQCLHGLGHALVFFLDYKLEKSLGACAALSDGWAQSSCYGGAFMENVFTATPEKRDLSPTDYHYPCSKLYQKYKSDCYVMQTTRMTEMGLGTERLFEECKKAGAPAPGAPGLYKLQCMQSVGRDLSNDARVKDPKLTSQKCEMVDGEERKACIRGVIYALIDNTWDGKYAFPFCDSFAAFEDASFCFEASGAYLMGTFTKTREDLKSDCKKYLDLPATCQLTAAN